MIKDSLWLFFLVALSHVMGFALGFAYAILYIFQDEWLRGRKNGRSKN